MTNEQQAEGPWHRVSLGTFYIWCRCKEGLHSPGDWIKEAYLNDLESRLAASEAKAKLADEMAGMLNRELLAWKPDSSPTKDWLARYDAIDAGGEG